MRKLINTTLLLVVAYVPLFSQEVVSHQLSMKEAKEFAIKNSPLIKNSNIDLAVAKEKIWQTTSIGLPQVSAKLPFQYFPFSSTDLNENPVISAFKIRS